MDIKTVDTRYKNSVKELIRGNYNYRNDSLVITIEPNNLKNYYSGEVVYISSGDSLTLVNHNFLFPENMKRTSVPFLSSGK